MKIKSILILSITSFMLMSCNKTNELYPGYAYDTGKFETNYYLEHNNVDQINVSKTTEFDASKYTFISNPTFGKKITGLTENDQTYTSPSGEKKFLEWNIDTPIEDYGTGYGPTENLSSIDDSFKNGFLSRLYDGRVRCDGYYAKSRVQLNKTGYSSFFPKQLVDSRYFAMALRGQTSCEGYEYSTAITDFKLTLYKHISNSNDYEAYVVSMNDILVPSNTHGISSLMCFYFVDVFGLNYQTMLNGVVAMTLTFSLDQLISTDSGDYEKYGIPVDDKDDEKHPHFCIMLYEIMIPRSSWR